MGYNNNNSIAGHDMPASHTMTKKQIPLIFIKDVSVTLWNVISMLNALFIMSQFCRA